MSSSRDIFTKVSDPEEKDKVFFDLAASKAEIIGKVHGPESDTYLLKAKYFLQGELECELMNVGKNPPSTGEMIMQIQLGAEKYLCSCPFHVRESRLFMKTSADSSADLFHLQRREDFRLRLPGSYKAALNLKSINGANVALSFSIIDLSGGGCKISRTNKNPEIKTDDTITGELQLPDRPPIIIKGIIRHQQEDANDKVQSMGIQFVELSEPAKNKIVALVMDLYRELFSRLSKK